MHEDTNGENTELDFEARYDAFLSLVADTREIWILVNADHAFLKIYSEEDAQEYVPVWPSAATAREYAQSLDESLSPKALSVPEFYQRWVPGLSKDEIEVGVFPTSDAYIWLTSAKELKQDLDDAMSAFF